MSEKPIYLNKVNIFSTKEDYDKFLVYAKDNGLHIEDNKEPSVNEFLSEVGFDGDDEMAEFMGFDEPF